MKKVTKLVGIVLPLFFATQVALGSDDSNRQLDAFDHEPILYTVKYELENGRLAKLAETSMDAILMTAVVELRLHDEHELADKIVREWKMHRQLFFWMDDLGDHEPLSQWIADTYSRVEEVLPAKVLEAIRFSDIKILNYAIPVVFEPTNEAWDRDEYRLHFVPFSGVVTYWSVNIGCSVSTTGIGSLIICPLAGRLAEKVMVVYVAPGLSDRVYDRAQEEI